MAPPDAIGPDASQLRERLPQNAPKSQQPTSPEAARQAVVELNAAEAKREDGKEKRTYGRTPDGTVFNVPYTYDMVSQLLSPTQPKNISDGMILLALGSLILTMYILPSSLRIPVFAVLFLFWRACYNAGLGYLLQIQSQDKRLVSWAKKSKIFENPATGKNPYPQLWSLLKREMETKIPNDYKFEDAPIEYNTWLVFRRVVDLILMCDFMSYVLFAFACAGRPAGEQIYMTVGRWTAGIILFLFNLWVKLDAHRVVKDYAWYWGDFFYMIDQELTFDGVFEMAPHPMYSVGYAGYYGISLMAASYKVLFISIIAHAAQFAFLTLVENPHIEKIYNTPPPRKRSDGVHSGQDEATTSHPSGIHGLWPPQNFDLHRVADVSVLLLQFYIFMAACFTPNSQFYEFLFVANAVLWRLWFSLGIGFILNRQSNKKAWTRHFIKYGDDTEEAWRQWKGFYHLSMSMCYAGFISAAWKMYHLPADWSYGMTLLRHVLGAGLISLHLWTVVSIHDELGEFGWFYGDFFFEPLQKPTYGGIYRFLNNPERFLGLAGAWGFAIITWSKAIFFLAFLSHILTLLFLQFIEAPHMQKLYGQQSLRQASGVSKTFRQALPSPIREWQMSLDQWFENWADNTEALFSTMSTKVAADVNMLMNDSRQLLNANRLDFSKEAKDLNEFDKSAYTIKVEGTPTSDLAWLDRRSGREGENGRQIPVRTDSSFKPLMFEYGAPIKVRWTAPLNHSKQDWIGLYMVSDNVDREVTRITSRGRWVATTPTAYDSVRPDVGIISSDVETGDHLSGEMEFSGDKLWWTTGVFEFRYHHDGKHNVMAISPPFEIRIGHFDEDDIEVDLNGSLRGAVEQALLPVLRNCFDRDPEIAPSTVEETFGSLVERDGRFAKRVVFAVHHMFGIEFAPEVVKADGNVKNLAWRICNAKKALAPYSLSSPDGSSTPSEIKY
ncbi:phosphatidylethanolamine N-methyltransferase [Venturia nashicola]|uniref:Phosphatidylethanolamine N-methyltransferase n=1 Tax=Venturia nashicola TaxID=86259 RepID=A0A4Z1PP44_9PEZI|nr:phosphatidylethanolamine N-methyltransferase [Venturia nashicola]TLD37787.1 phosphatidylethanolamine N-methyltransferase [Venturia nashicola]